MEDKEGEVTVTGVHLVVDWMCGTVHVHTAANRFHTLSGPAARHLLRSLLDRPDFERIDRRHAGYCRARNREAWREGGTFS